ncbi:MAG: hypothetical protein CAK90_06540 [Spartobacteria bacterium AMD-G4]|nr:MAG: hypothetical protein CAK90_06540 [Spartobacteria bacterium AMD-G4]
MSLVCHSLGSVQKLKVAAKQGNIRLPEHTRSLFRIAQKKSHEFSVSDKKIVTRSLPHWFCGVAAARFLDAASACLLVCGGLSGDAGALAIRSAEQPGGWGQCGGVLLRHEPPSHPRTQRMKIGFRITTAARKTSSAQGAIIAAETAAPRGCWPRDPRSGVVDKLR